MTGNLKDRSLKKEFSSFLSSFPFFFFFWDYSPCALQASLWPLKLHIHLPVMNANWVRLNVRNILSLTFTYKATIISCIFFSLWPAVQIQADVQTAKVNTQSLPTCQQFCVIKQRRRHRDRVCRRIPGSTGWGAGWADTILGGTSWTRRTLCGKTWGKTKALP